MSGPLGAGALQYFSGAKKFYSYEMDQSVRFNDDDNAHFSKLWSSAGNRQTFTYSFWIKRANIGSRMDFISFQQDVPIIFNSDTLRVFLFGGDRLITNRQFRDVSAWYHIVLSVDSTDSTSGDRIKLYVNGDRETDFSTESYPSLNANANIYTVGLNQTIGRLYGGSNYFDGYVADMYYLDGVAADPSSFGETKENIWVAKITQGATARMVSGCRFKIVHRLVMTLAVTATISRQTILQALTRCPTARQTTGQFLTLC